MSRTTRSRLPFFRRLGRRLGILQITEDQLGALNEQNTVSPQAKSDPENPERAQQPSGPSRSPSFTAKHKTHREFMMDGKSDLEKIEHLRSELIMNTWQLGTYVTMMVEAGESIECGEPLPEGMSFWAMTDTLAMIVREGEKLLTEMEEIIMAADRA